MTQLPRHFWPVLLMFAFSVASYFDRTILSIAAPSIIREFRLTETQMGLVFFSFQFSYTLLMTQGGRWADQYGPSYVLTMMGLGAGVLTALTPLGGIPGLGALIGVLPAMMILRFAFGVVTAPLYPSTGRLNADWVPPAHRTLAQGLVNAGAGFGGAISPLLFTRLMLDWGWRASFVASGVFTVALAMVWYFATRKLPRPKPADSRLAPQLGHWRRLRVDRNLQLLTAAYFAIDYFEYIFFFWLYYYLSEIRHIPSDQTALYTAAPFVAWVIMMPLGGWICDWAAKRFGQNQALRATAIIGLGSSVVLLIAALQSSHIMTTVICLSLAFGFCSIADVVCWTAAIAIAGDETGVVCGIMNTGGNLGGMLAPVLTPWIASIYGWPASLYFGGALVALAILTWLRIDVSRAEPRVQ